MAKIKKCHHIKCEWKYTDANVDHNHFGKQFQNNLNKIKDAHALKFSTVFPVLDTIWEKLLNETCSKLVRVKHWNQLKCLSTWREINKL